VNRRPDTVQVLAGRGVWRSDVVTRSARYARERLAWLTRSPRRQAVARIVDADGRAVQ
jgi:hypothetical protein